MRTPSVRGAIMRRRLPPLEQIEAFVEAAHGPSFRVAAERCALSPAAFSRRIQAFSNFLGLTLFERHQNGVRLTDTGRRCFAELEPAYLELRRAASSVVGDDDDSMRVTLSLSHSLAVGWLIPRLESFRSAHPQIELTLRTQRDASELCRGDADLGLCFSDVDLNGLASRPLLEVAATPVAAPAVAALLAADQAPLKNQRLLSVTSPPQIWNWWARSTGYEENLKASASFDILHAMYESASEGLGIAMGASPTVWPFLDSGRLVRIGLPAARLPGGAYHLAARRERKRKRSVSAVWRWLEREAAGTRQFADATNAAGIPAPVHA
jgi:DNA-binding transcriptional LysR family regulator